MAGTSSEQINSMPVVRDRAAFDASSGNALERLVFNHRFGLIVLCALLSVFFGFKVATGLRINASFEKMIPQSSPYIRNYVANKADLKGLGNSLRIVVENTQGSIYDPAYLEALRKINDTVFLMPGVDRPWVKSIWMPAVRWNSVTEKGYAGGPVMPPTYNGSAASIDALRSNVARAGITGSLVANDLKSSMIVVPLLERDAAGQPIDYAHLSHLLDDMVRTQQKGDIRIHVVGFAKLIGDLIDGLKQVMTYFGVAAAIALCVIFFYTRCPRSTFLVVACSLVAVLWQLGIVTTLGLVIDPYSVLVPFLVFAIGVSHGAQKMNGILQDVGRGTHRYVAARYTFRRLFLAGLTALMADMVGFAVLTIIDIPVIKDLALTASIGVGVLVFTNLLLLPVLLSYVGVSPAAAQRTMIEEADEARRRSRITRLWHVLDRFTERRWALGAVAAALVLAAAGFSVSERLQIGDLGAGAPELRANSQYNRDNAFINGHYGLSSDMFVVIGKSSLVNCDADHYQMLVDADRLEMALQDVPGVQTTSSAASLTRLITSGAYEGYPKWYTINRTPAILNRSLWQVLLSRPDLISPACNTMPIIAYLSDHKAATLNRVLDAAQHFADTHQNPNHRFLLAAGSAGIDAATNIVVKQANQRMLLLVYAAVVLLCLITFRSWRAAIVALVPLVITSVLCEALMVMLGIGVKVATLPVIALGVGIGVDYALYLLSVQLNYQRAGLPLREAYRRAVQFTGKVVALVGVTLAAGVVTWAWSPIKFQADMGILLTFMFVGNMIGALILIPSLSHLLLRKVSSTPGRARQGAAMPLAAENSKGA